MQQEEARQKAAQEDGGTKGGNSTIGTKGGNSTSSAGHRPKDWFTTWFEGANIPKQSAHRTWERFLTETERPKITPGTRDAARILSERIAEAAGNTTGAVLPEGRPPKPGDETVQFAQFGAAPSRAQQAGVSLRTQRKLDALARRRPDLLAEVRERRMSVHRAAMAAGIVKPPDVLQQLLRLWDKASLCKHVYGSPRRTHLRSRRSYLRDRKSRGECDVLRRAVEI